MERSPSHPLIQSVSRFLTQWCDWWKNLSVLQKLFPVSAIVLYWISLTLLGGIRGDHFLTGGVLLLLSYTGPPGRYFLRFALPFLLTAIVYDSQRFYGDYLRGPIHVSEPYHFDRFFFGIQTSHGILTPNEWFQLHTHPILDLISGFAYLTFFTIYVLISAYFYFYISRVGTSKMKPDEVFKKARFMPWCFLWLNLLGYTTYYWYPAAPPWYVSEHGLGPAKMNVTASVAGCIRFDQLLGTHFFSQMYARAADVFGAIPSLHVAYPLLAIVFSFYFGAARAFSIGFYIVMCFSAVYLNHHYILDILWGSSYALLIGFLCLYWPFQIAEKS
jgi:membrane-associated phospholipid phosphatase